MIKISENDLIDRYKKLMNDALSQPNIPARDLLESYSDEELFIFVAGQTLFYGRSYEKSIENAKCHVNEGRDKVINTWVRFDRERDIRYE